MNQPLLTMQSPNWNNYESTAMYGDSHSLELESIPSFLRTNNPKFQPIRQRDIEKGRPRSSRLQLPTAHEYQLMREHASSLTTYRSTLKTLFEALGDFENNPNHCTKHCYFDWLHTLHLFVNSDEIIESKTTISAFIFQSIITTSSRLNHPKKRVFENYIANLIHTIPRELADLELDPTIDKNFLNALCELHAIVFPCLELVHCIGVRNFVRLEKYFLYTIDRLNTHDALRNSSHHERAKTNDKFLKIETFLEQLQKTSSHNLVANRMTKMRKKFAKLALATDDPRWQILFTRMGEYRPLTISDKWWLAFVHFGGIALFITLIVFYEFNQQIKDLAKTPFNYITLLGLMASLSVIYFILSCYGICLRSSQTD